MSIKSLLTRVKPYLRWVILGGTLFFVVKTLKDHWQDVTAIQVTATSWSWFAAAFVVTLVAHVWSGWVWHFFGRVRALQQTGTSTGIAVLAVVMEPLLMAVAALVWACLCGGALEIGRWGDGEMGERFRGLVQVVVLGGALVSVHPRVFNPVLQRLSRAKAKAQGLSFMDAPRLRTYPWRSLLGEMGFVGLRSLGFIMIVAALMPVPFSAVPSLVAAFSLAWLMGLVVPGAPGGIGVFEATAIPLLSGQFPVAIVLSSVAIYRLVSVLAEVAAAGLVWLGERFIGKVSG